MSKTVDVAHEKARMDLYKSGAVKAEATSVTGLLMMLVRHLYSEGVTFTRLKDKDLRVEIRFFETDKPS